jgi:hypothetical protein
LLRRFLVRLSEVLFRFETEAATLYVDVDVHWPDHGVPESARSIVDLLDGVHKHMDINSVN